MSEPRVTEAAPAMPADPVVSPADTIRRFLALPGPAFLDELPPWSEAKSDASAALAALLAVGERDKAERDAAIAAAADLTVEIDEAHAERDAALNAGERDRRQIARLTEALERIRANLTIDSREGVWDPSEAKKIARAVLADKEDAANG